MHDLSILILVLGIVIGLPWLIFHYVTQWKKNSTLTREDENLLDELHELARRLDDRVRTVERIVAAENPNWRDIGSDAPALAIEDNHENLRRIK